MKNTRLKSLGFVVTGISLFFGLATYSVAAETWECALDLQQGDRGSLSLERDDDAVTGKIKFDRNGTQFEQEIEGRWNGREVELTRFVDANSSQAMHAIAIRIVGKQVKMGGRFDEGLTGVWSADCALLAGSGTTTDGQESTTSSQVLPSISLQASPFKPSSKDKIEFTAKASHPDGINSVALFLNDQQIKSCDGNSCSHTQQPLADGIYNWHVTATSKNGIQNATQPKTLVVKSSKKRNGACSIIGLATGAAVAQSTTVTIKLIGEGKHHTTRFDAGVYTFNNITAGDYTLSLDISAESALLASPTTIQVSCAAGQTIQQNFELN